jgi:hypothetical protein
MLSNYQDGPSFLAELRRHLTEEETDVPAEERQAVADLVDDILPFVIQEGDLDAAPAWDLVPFGRPVAELIPVTDLPDQAVVVIDRQLLAVANRVATAFAMALPATVDGDRLQLQIDDDVRAGLQSRPPDEDEDPDVEAPPPAWALALTAEHPAVQTYVDAMLALQNWAGLSDEAPPLDPLREPIVATVQQVSAWFELALPFAHVAAGHDLNEDTERLPWIEGDFVVDRFQWDEDQDEEATARAILAVINRSKQVFGDLRMAVWALDSWLATRMLIAGAPMVVKNLTQDVFERHVNRHAERRALLRALLEEDDELRPTLVVASALEPIMAQFWEHTIAALMDGGAPGSLG